MVTQEKIYIGVDSGGTKTIASAVTASGQFLGIGYGGPTNAYFVSEDDAISAMRVAVAAALGVPSSDPIPLPQVQVVYLSAPGFTPDAAERALRDLCPNAVIKVEGDAPAAFRAAIPRGDGIVVLSGTGSFGAALWKGTWLTNGGWGPLLGDEGSGYWIGLQALRAVALAADGRGPKTALQEVFRRALHYSFDIELRRFAYKRDLNRQRISALTILVMQAARDGDPIAHSILVEAGKELAKLGANLAERLEVGKSPVPVSLVGGVARTNSPVVISFQESIETTIPNAHYGAPRFEPWVGALILALELENQTIKPETLEEISRGAASTLGA